MIVSAYQQLGTVDQLISSTFETFAYPEHGVVTPTLSDGTTERNYVLQSSGLSVRQARRTWLTVPTEKKELIGDLAATKEIVSYTEEDGTVRNVIVMDFAAHQQFAGYWEVSVRLIETSDPVTPGPQAGSGSGS